MFFSLLQEIGFQILMMILHAIKCHIMQYHLSCDMGGVLIMIIQTQNPLWQHLIGLNKACFLQDNTCLFHIIHPKLKAVPAAVQQFQIGRASCRERV